MQQRIKYIDLGEAIMLLYVLLHHAIGISVGLYNSRFFAIDGGAQQGLPDHRVFFPFLMFFMPWFFYKAGMLFRIRPKREFFKYDMKKMLKPLLVWTAVAYVVLVIELIISGGVTLRAISYSVVRIFYLTGKLETNGPLWFLLTLFFVRQIGNVSLKYCHPLFVALAGFLISYFCHKTNFRLMPFWVANTGSGLFFFFLGYFFSQYDSREISEKKSVQIIAALIFVAWCVASYFMPQESLSRVPIVDMIYNNALQGHYVLSYPVCLAGIWAFNGLLKVIEDKRSYPFLNWVAHNAMQIYVIHGLVYGLFAWIVFKYFYRINPIMMFSLIIVLYGIMMLCIYHNNQRSRIKFQRI